MGKVIYLLGAGASANALPTYANFKARLELFKAFLDYRKQDVDESNLKTGPREDSLLDSLDFLLKEMNYHSTPDTVVKKYFHLDDQYSIRRIKATLICYFLYEQKISELFIGIDKDSNPVFQQRLPVDHRYDALMASLLIPERGLSLHKNVSILSWNYDYQLELAFNRYQIRKDILTSRIALNSYPDPFTNHSVPIHFTGFAVLHLNGVAFGKPENPIRISLFNADFFTKDNLPVDDLFFIYRQFMFSKDENGFPEKPIDPFFYFAWETTWRDNRELTWKNEIKTAAIHLAKEADTLIVCGYSFPSFNRAIDKEIIGNMRGLKRLYLQTENPEVIINPINEIRKSAGMIAIDAENIYVSGIKQGFPIPGDWEGLPM